MKGEIKMEREVDKIRKDLAKHILSGAYDVTDYFERR